MAQVDQCIRSLVVSNRQATPEELQHTGYGKPGGHTAATPLKDDGSDQHMCWCRRRRPQPLPRPWGSTISTHVEVPSPNPTHWIHPCGTIDATTGANRWSDGCLEGLPRTGTARPSGAGNPGEGTIEGDLSQERRA